MTMYMVTIAPRKEHREYLPFFQMMVHAESKVQARERAQSFEPKMFNRSERYRQPKVWPLKSGQMEVI